MTMLQRLRAHMPSESGTGSPPPSHSLQAPQVPQATVRDWAGEGVIPEVPSPHPSLWGPCTLQVGTAGDGSQSPPGPISLAGQLIGWEERSRVWTSAPSSSPDGSGGPGEWRRGGVWPQHLIFTTSGRDTPVVLLLNSRDSDPFLTETHECLPGREQPQGSSSVS